MYGQRSLSRSWAEIAGDLARLAEHHESRIGHC